MEDRGGRRRAVRSTAACAAITVAGTLAFAAPAAAGAAPDDQLAREDRIEDLERKVEILTDELSRLRTQQTVPEEADYRIRFGHAPAAGKVYGAARGLSIGGYGEGFYTNFFHDDSAGASPDVTKDGPDLGASEALDRADMLRLVLYLGYKFTDHIVFNSEIEFEHAKIGEEGISAGSGEVGIEFATLDFFWKDAMNLRTGLMLIPMGFINEVHEPPFFHGVQRPEVERRLLPATWRENGVGIFGQLGETLEYRAYVVTGFVASGFSDAGIRGGRQNGNRAFAEDLAFVARADWTPHPGVTLGGSFYTGKSGQDLQVDLDPDPDVFAGSTLPGARLTMWETHAQLRRGGLHARALFTMSQLANAEALNLALGRDPTKPIAERMLGGYGELAYDIWPWLSDSDRSLSPFVRVEYVDTQDRVPDGFLENRARAFWLVTSGIGFKPHPNVVLKAELRNFLARSGEIPDEINLGFGFAF